MQENDSGFNYTYSAKEREEVHAIRNKYVSQPGVDKMDYLRRLDSSVHRTAVVHAITLGVVGALVLGTGMSLIMTDLGASIGLHSSVSLIIGVIEGMVGLIMMGLASPLYNLSLRRGRTRIAPVIMELTDELLR